LALLAWLESMKPENQAIPATEARVAMLDKALKLNPNCERAHFYRGMLHKRLGNDKAAYKDFKDSADLNPRNIDAVREVRLYAMRKGGSVPPPGSKRTSQPPPGGGLFGKLFKK
jgi:tetratricopeptide (TPR) repeat protein